MNEIIIDGCNVAECEFLLSNYECMSNYNCDCGEITQFDKCKDCPDCYYKQLQRAKAENEKLEEIIKQAIKDFNHEIGTPYYDKLCENAIKLKIIKDAEKLS